jgi:6-pyruvoyltetrahydropterin/6-carboxytetrahydropterin synthase
MKILRLTPQDDDALMTTYLTRRVTFDATHRYWRSDWSDDENRRAFGLWATPKFHGHEYVCDVTVTGDVDRVTGMIVDLGRLDSVLQAEVRDRFASREINLDVSEFTDGRLVPTCENLARFIAECVQRALGRSATVTAVRVAEDETISATHRPGEGETHGR